MNNKGKNISQKIIVETYTPLHIGSGENLKTSDFYMDKDKVFVPDIQKTLQSIQSTDSRINKYLKTSNLQDLIEISGKQHGYHLDCSFSQNSSNIENKTVKSGYPYQKGNTNKELIKEIREYVKDAFYKPLLPGSSIKGAIRTALWASSLSQSSKDLIKNESLVFRKNLQQDILSTFKISDGYFEITDLELGRLQIANVSDNKIKWKDLSNRANKKDWKDTPGLYTEIIKAQSKVELLLSWDEFLLNNTKWMTKNNHYQQSHYSQQNDHSQKNHHSQQSRHARESGHPEDASLLNKIQSKIIENIKNFQTLKQVLNQQALNMVENEIHFFTQYEHKPAIEFYQALKKQIEKKDKAWLRMSWGGGWTGMTGLTKPVLDQSQELKQYIQYRNRNKQKPYPKTRRLLEKNGRPYCSLGWISFNLASEKETVKNPYRESTISHSRASGDNFSENLSQVITDIKNEHNIKNTEDVLKGKVLAEYWKNLDSKEKKQKMLEEIKNYWKKQGWWDEPDLTKSQKKSKQIYESNS